MSNYAEIVALVEGETEKIFIEELLAPHLVQKNIYLKPILISKPGQKGGDVKFARVKNDMELHLKQRHDTYLTLFVDYYGIKKDWPGLNEAKKQSTPDRKAEVINNATKGEVKALFGAQNAQQRFIPYVSMHEFEALLFSLPRILALHLQVEQSKIDEILFTCRSPEQIDDSSQTAPSKQLEKLSPKFKKTTTGITVAKATGLLEIRQCCPIFNSWVTKMESVSEAPHS